jgi:hypothetical protein
MHQTGASMPFRQSDKDDLKVSLIFSSAKKYAYKRSLRSDIPTLIKIRLHANRIK